MYPTEDYNDADGSLLIPCVECEAPCSGELTTEIGEPLCIGCYQK